MADEQKVQIEVPTKGTLTFGKVGLNLPTPKWVTQAFRAILYVVAISGLLCNIITEIPVELRDLINHYGIEVVAVIHLLSRFAGIKPEDYAIPETN